MGNHPFCRMGKTTINRRFSIAMLNYRRVFGGQRRGQKRKMWLSNIVNQPNGDSLSPFSTTLPAPQFIGFGTCLHFQMLSSQWLLSLKGYQVARCGQAVSLNHQKFGCNRSKLNKTWISGWVSPKICDICLPGVVTWTIKMWIWPQNIDLEEKTWEQVRLNM